MRVKIYYSLLIFLLLGTFSAHSQEIHAENFADFRVNENYVDTSFSNTPRVSEIQPEVGQAPNSTVAVAEPECWTRQLHIKTNVLGLGMAIANLAVEVDLAKHWSFTLPVYYSAWDYFKTTVKFRTLMVQPEVRYWFNRHNEGWFLGAHFGYGYYNFALDGEYRTQDYNRETPSMGGGLAIGYRTHLSKNKRWKMEFSVGGGVYDSHYDQFRNVENGFLVRTEKKTWYGVDQAAISFVYSFNLSRNGGKR